MKGGARPPGRIKAFSRSVSGFMVTLLGLHLGVWSGSSGFSSGSLFGYLSTRIAFLNILVDRFDHINA